VCAQRNARGGKAVQRCAARRRWGPIRRGGCGTTGAEGAARLGKETSEGWSGTSGGGRFPVEVRGDQGDHRAGAVSLKGGSQWGARAKGEQWQRGRWGEMRGWPPGSRWGAPPGPGRRRGDVQRPTRGVGARSGPGGPRARMGALQRSTLDSSTGTSTGSACGA
jgi:hypothetical protein